MSMRVNSGNDVMSHDSKISHAESAQSRFDLKYARPIILAGHEIISTEVA